jgi:hypothetical protein
MGDGKSGSTWTRDEITDVIESIPSDLPFRPFIEAEA